MSLSSGELQLIDASTISTSTGNLTIGAATGADVLIGDNATLLTVDGGAPGVKIGTGALTANTHFDIDPATFTAAVDGSARVIRVLGTITEAGSGTHASIGGMEINPPTITGGSAAVTDTFTVKIVNAPTATVTGANYALWVDAGVSRFDGYAGFGTTTTALSAFVEAIDINQLSIMSWDGSNVESKIGFFHTDDAPGAAYLLHNATYNGTAWSCFDTGEGSHQINFAQSGAMYFGAMVSGNGEPTIRMAIDTGGNLDLHNNDLLNVGASGSDWDTTSLRNAGDYFGANGKGMVIGHTAKIATGGVTTEFQVVGNSVAEGSMTLYTASTTDASASQFNFVKNANATVGTHSTVVADDEALGIIYWRGSDTGDVASQAASIAAFVDGTPGSNDMPGRLVFSTTADDAASPTERMRIDSSGNVGIGTGAATPSTPVSVLELYSPTYQTVPTLTMTVADNSIIAGDGLANINFRGTDTDASGGTGHAVARTGATIRAVADDTWGTDVDDNPTRLEFRTQTNGNTDGMATRMQIKSTGEIDLQSNALGLTNVGASGNDWTAYSLLVSSSNAGNKNVIQVTNTENSNANSRAVFYARTGGSDSGDPYTHYSVAGVFDWVTGLDESNSSAYVISRSSSPGTTDAMRIATDGETTFDNVGSEFTPDYVCDSCGRAEIESFECCGTVAWHDDVLALREMKLSQAGIDQMVKLGVYELDGPDDSDPGWTGINFQKAMHFTWAGMWQNRERMDAQHEAMDARLKRIEQALGV